MQEHRSPTRSVLLELKEERGLIKEGYDFLDEKRMLLANGILRELEAYQKALQEFERIQQEASGSLQSALARHGLDGLTVYPAVNLEEAELSVRRRSFVGVSLVETSLRTVDTLSRPAPIHPSPEGEHCRELFERLLAQAVQLAGIAGNLYRLSREYTRTERRARALENVLLPETDLGIKFVEEQLEVLDQEDAVRARRRVHATRAFDDDNEELLNE